MNIVPTLTGRKDWIICRTLTFLESIRELRSQDSQLNSKDRANSFTVGRVLEEEVNVHHKLGGRKQLNLNKFQKAECGTL